LPLALPVGAPVDYRHESYIVPFGMAGHWQGLPVVLAFASHCGALRAFSIAPLFDDFLLFDHLGLICESRY